MKRPLKIERSHDGDWIVDAEGYLHTPSDLPELEASLNLAPKAIELLRVALLESERRYGPPAPHGDECQAFDCQIRRLLKEWDAALVPTPDLIPTPDGRK